MESKITHQIILRKIRPFVTPRQWLVLYYYYWKDMKGREIAALIHVSEGRVSALHAKGLIALKETLCRMKIVHLNQLVE